MLTFDADLSLDTAMPQANTPTDSITFITIGDVEATADNLTVSAKSSNIGLVPNSNVDLSSSGASRTVTIAPATGLSGEVYET